jgi:hypothetical protein
LDNTKVTPMAITAPESFEPQRVFSAQSPKAAALSRMAQSAQWFSGEISVSTAGEGIRSASG